MFDQQLEAIPGLGFAKDGEDLMDIDSVETGPAVEVVQGNAVLWKSSEQPIAKPSSKLTIKFKNPTYYAGAGLVQEVVHAQAVSRDIESRKRRRLSKSPETMQSDDALPHHAQAQVLLPIVKAEPITSSSTSKLLVPDDGLDEILPIKNYFPPLAERKYRRAESCPPCLPTQILQEAGATREDSVPALHFSSQATSESGSIAETSDILSEHQSAPDLLCVPYGTKAPSPDPLLKFQIPTMPQLQWHRGHPSLPYSPFGSAHKAMQEAMEKRQKQIQIRDIMVALAKLRPAVSDFDDSGDDSNSSLSSLASSSSGLSSLSSSPRISVQQIKDEVDDIEMLEYIPPVRVPIEEQSRILPDLPLIVKASKSPEHDLTSTTDKPSPSNTPYRGLKVNRPSAKHYLPKVESSPAKSSKKNNGATDSKKRKRGTQKATSSKRDGKRRSDKDNVWGQKKKTKVESWPGGKFDFYIEVPPLPKELRKKKKVKPSWYYKPVSSDVEPAEEVRLLEKARTNKSAAIVQATLRDPIDLTASSPPPFQVEPEEATIQNLELVRADLAESLPNQDISMGSPPSVVMESVPPVEHEISQHVVCNKMGISRALSQMLTESSMASIASSTFQLASNQTTPPTSDDVCPPEINTTQVPSFSTFLFPAMNAEV